MLVRPYAAVIEAGVEVYLRVPGIPARRHMELSLTRVPACLACLACPAGLVCRGRGVLDEQGLGLLLLVLISMGPGKRH